MKSNLFLRAALFYAQRLRWPVFPIKPRAKTPLTKHGFKDATMDEKQIRQWWEMWPDANIGVPTGEQFWVLDVDPRHGGEDSRAALVQQHGALADTLRQTTGGGGSQYLYEMPDQAKITNATQVCGWKGIDVRGEGGYIVVPPSVHPSGGVYKWDTAKHSMADEAINPADPWLIEAICAKSRNGPKPPFQLPEKIPHGSQHDYLVREAGKLRAMGMGYEEIVEAIWQTNLTRCEKPGPRKNIEQIARSVCNYPPGKFPEEAKQQRPTSAATHEATRNSNAQLRSKGKLIYTYANVPSIWDFESTVRYILPDLVPEGGITLITGDSGHGKTIFVTAMARAIVTGGEFLGRLAQRRKVIYLDRENPLGLVKQHLLDLHIEKTSNLIYWGNWCEYPADGPASVSLLELARAERPVLTFDSLIAFHPGDEQDASETRRYLQHFRNLAAAGATIIVLHHIGKGDNARQYRGSTDIKASVDVAWLLEKIGDPAGLLSELRLVPFKNRIGTSNTIPLSFRDGYFVTEQRAESNREIFERVVRTNPNATGAEMEKLGMTAGLPKHRIAELLLEGVRQGWLQMRLGKRNAKHYSLAEPTLGEI
jgi:archaellum biogenesis ATPase FlaH